MAAIRSLIGAPIYSDVGVLYTPDFDATGDWETTLPLTNLQAPELYKAARSKTATLADTRLRVDLKTDRAVRVLGLVYRSPEHVGAPSTAAKVRFVGQPSSAQGVLFDYEAGNDPSVIAGYSYSRASTASYTDASGVVRTAASGVLRDSHFIGGVRHTLLEPSRTNRVIQSEDFGTTWVALGTPTRTPAAFTVSGISLDLIGDDDAGVLEGYTQNIAFSGAGNEAVSIYVAQGSSTSSCIRLRDTTAGAQRLEAFVTWSGGLPSVTTTVGTYLGYESLAGGSVFRLLFSNVNVTVVNTNQLQILPAAVSGLAVTNTGTIYAGGVQVEDGTFPTSYIKTTTVTVTRAADALSFTGPSSDGTIYSKFWNLSTLAYVESTVPYTGGTPITLGGAAYVSTRINTGTASQAQMQAIIYDSGWLTPFPAGRTVEDTEDQNLGAWAFPASTINPVRYVTVQIDDALNAAGFIDLNRLLVTGGIQSATGLTDGAKITLETATQTSTSDIGVIVAMRKPTRRTVSLLLPEQTEAENAQQLSFQRVAGIDRQFVFAWDPTDTTYLQDRTFLATLAKLSDFEATIGFRWGIPYAIREVL